MEEAPKQDRRVDKRVLNIRPCFYELAHIADHEIVDITDGHALSLDASPGGFLLLMPQPPERRQVFEVHATSSTEEEETIKLVEACWTRELTFGVGGKVYLVGVRSLFEPARSTWQ
ncbi:MAG TPA: hypothetical protein VLE03_04060 [Nitrospiraceae bacterium]|nr:hypothetical protein [Nitrospiraceae bacterium]